ncbi:MAG: COG4315 family predicted lipoprotein [Solirubrobacteraceae bacterium]
MKRIVASIAAAAAVVGAPAAVIGASAAATRPTGSATRTLTVKLARTAIGPILVTRSGFTLYMFTRDRRRTETCLRIRGCLGVWPPLTVTGKPVGGPGLRAALLGTIRLHGRVRQVTYAGHPLYRYAFDSGPGDTGYVGANQFGGYWFAVNSRGGTVR